MSFDSVINDWLARRKITESVRREFAIQAGHHNGFGDCIVIPVHDENGKFAFNKYRRSPLADTTPKYIYDLGGHLVLYGAWKAKDAETVLWVEGEMDCLVAWSANIASVTGTGGARSCKPEWKEFFANKETIICFDNDLAGGEGMAKAHELVPEAKILFLPDRAGMKDISDYVTSGGDLHELLKTAKAFKTLEEVIADKAERLATWRSTHFHEAYLKLHSEKPANSIVREQHSDAVKRAKSYPITDLLAFNSRGSALCLWHNETEPSLHYYPATNSCYCFGGCGRAYDAIDVYRKLYNVGFTEAVRKLQ